MFIVFRIWISRSWLMSLYRSIPFMLRRHLQTIMFARSEKWRDVTSKVLSASLHNLWEILSKGSLEISRRNVSKQIAYRALLELCRLLDLDPFSRNFFKSIIFANIILFPNNFQVSEVLPRNNIILGHFVNEMKILLLYKNASLSCRGYEMSEKDTATWCDLKKKMVSQFCLPFVHSSSNMCEMYVFLFFRLANFM